MPIPGETVEGTTRHIGEGAEEEEALELPTGRNIIVAIGIDAYQHHPPLNNPINDAKAVLDLFMQCSFQELPGVPSLIANDATRAAIADLPNLLATKLKPDDSLVVFFAGHGDKIERQVPDPAEPGKTRTHRTGYLIPVDGPKDKPGEWIELEGFLWVLSGLPARHIFVILDACKSGIALDEKFKSRGRDEPAAIAELRRRSSRRVLTSAMHDQKALEGGSGTGHSIFAEALIEAIRDRQADKDENGYIPTWDLFSFVHDRVSEQADKLSMPPQNPDYGRFHGDGGGDLVISLREGDRNRLIQDALGAMLRHDMPRLEELVKKLVAAYPDYPVTLYLQFRLKFMQGEISAAEEIVSRLRDLGLPPGTLPLSQTELWAFSLQRGYWEPLLSMPVGSPPIAIDLLGGCRLEDLHAAPVMLGPAGNVYQIENGARAQFAVTNLSDSPMYLYYITVLPTGRLLIGPLLDPHRAEFNGLESHTTGYGRAFRLKGLPGSVFETRIVCSPRIIWQLQSPSTYGSGDFAPLEDPLLSELQILTVWYQIPEGETPMSVGVHAISEAFEL